MAPDRLYKFEPKNEEKKLPPHLIQRLRGRIRLDIFSTMCALEIRLIMVIISFIICFITVVTAAITSKF